VHFNQQQAKPALRLSQCAPPNWPVSSGRKHTHCANPHSNNRSTQTNPTISRLSDSPTLSNVPRYTNVARGVRETYTNADFRDPLNMLQRSSSLQPFVQNAAFFLAETSVCGTRTKPLLRQWRLLRVLCADFGRVDFEI
jgi:hypothetical protein